MFARYLSLRRWVLMLILWTGSVVLLNQPKDHTTAASPKLPDLARKAAPAATIPKHELGWGVVPSPNVSGAGNYLSGIAGARPGDIWAAGYYSNPDNVTQTLVEHWNGSKWGIVSSPNVGVYRNYLKAIGAVSCPSCT